MSKELAKGDGRLPDGTGALVNQAPTGLGPDGLRSPIAGRRKTLSVYEKPLPARLILARALGVSTDEAGLALAVLIEGGYGIAPRLPTNGMLAAYIEATAPARNHEAIITAIGKARVRWQAMLEQGTAMAMSLKYVPAVAESDAPEPVSHPTGDS